MSIESTYVASPMRGAEAWRRTLEIRERYLAAGDPDLLPPPDCARAGENEDLIPLIERFTVIVDVPPLRERAADIPALADAIIGKLRPQRPRPRCTPEALAALVASDWPGNIRQLRQVVATALVRSMSCDITLDDLPGYHGAARGGRRGRLRGLERAERQALLAALRDAGGDREAAARDLGISRATIYRKLKRLRISPPAAALRPVIQEGA